MISCCNYTYVILKFLLYFNFIVIVKKVLVKYGYYDLILSSGELELLDHFVELLEIFEDFTKYIQGESYPTQNSVILFRTEIIDR